MRAPEVAERAQELLAGRFLVTDWRRLNRELFTALRLQQWALFLVLGLIVVVSTFNVASTLVVLVRERMRDIGVLAAFGIPRMLKSVERSKAAEAFKYLASVRAAQERYQARQGTYADDLANLDMEQSAPKYFDVPLAYLAVQHPYPVNQGFGSGRTTGNVNINRDNAVISRDHIVR